MTRPTRTKKTNVAGGDCDCLDRTGCSKQIELYRKNFRRSKIPTTKSKNKNVPQKREAISKTESKRKPNIMRVCRVGQPKIRKSKTQKSKSEKRLSRSLATPKMCEFVREPLGEKPVSCVPGIGFIYGEKLCERGFDKAIYLLGVFLAVGRDVQMFREWLVRIAGIKPMSASDASQSLAEWCSNFMN
ncbi:hypothetical protein ACOME3_007843 [Neoechinorhynchus agilis]